MGEFEPVFLWMDRTELVFAAALPLAMLFAMWAIGAVNSGCRFLWWRKR